MCVYIYVCIPLDIRSAMCGVSGLPMTSDSGKKGPFEMCVKALLESLPLIFSQARSPPGRASAQNSERIEVATRGLNGLFLHPGRVKGDDPKVLMPDLLPSRAQPTESSGALKHRPGVMLLACRPQLMYLTRLLLIASFAVHQSSWVIVK